MPQLAVTFIYNPQAGPRNWDFALLGLADWWRERGWRVTMRPTRAPGHATELARLAAGQAETLVLAIGGDGTLNEVAAGLVGSDTVLGLIPAGTGNSFAQEMGLPRSLSGRHLISSSIALLKGRVQPADIGLTDQGRYWLLWSGIGLDAHLVTRMEPRSKLYKFLGKAGYMLQAFRYLPSFKPGWLTVTVDGHKVSGQFLQVLICNCRFWAGGNIPINPQGVMDDGRFEVWCFAGKHPGEAIYYTFQGWRCRHENLEGVTMLAGSHIEVSARRPFPLHLDAEPSGTTPFGTTLIPRALNLLVPESAPSGLFQGNALVHARFEIENSAFPQ